MQRKHPHQPQTSLSVRRPVMQILSLLLLASHAGIAPDGANAADRISLREDQAQTRSFRVNSQVQVTGTVYTKTADGKSQGQPLDVKGRYEFAERRLAGLGRDARAFRTVRFYEQAQAEIRVGEQASLARLRPSMGLIVAVGESEGVLFFSPAGPLQFAELELLQSPGDSLALRALLPDDPVEPGDSWKPPEWSLQMLVGMEAAQKATLNCKFDNLTNSVARISVTGEIDGATLGTPSKLTIEGWIDFDTELKTIRAAQIVQKEKRSIGTVSPGLDVEAKVTLQRVVHSDQARLGDANLDQLPLEPNDANQLVRFDVGPWGLRFFHDRAWHVFHQTPRVAILRLLDKGNLIAQCNIEKLPTPANGAGLTLPQFEAEVQRALGGNITGVLQSSEVKTAAGLTALKVAAAGQSSGADMEWRYYLLRGPQGEQFVFVYVVEPKNIELLGAKDLAIVEGAELFKPVSPSPANAAPGDAGQRPASSPTTKSATKPSVSPPK